jgi:hypothetical protein
VINEIGWCGTQCIEHGSKTRRGRINFSALVCDWNHTSCKDKEMTALFSLKLKGFGKAFEHLLRDVDITALFEPGIPGNANSREMCNFISSESWGSSPANNWQSKLLRVQTSAMCSQEISEFRPSFCVISHIVPSPGM